MYRQAQIYSLFYPLNMTFLNAADDVSQYGKGQNGLLLCCGQTHQKKPFTMKTILVPTDYSEISDNALRYSVQLAQHLKAQIVLLHIYEIPVPSAELPILAVAEEMETENRKRIQHLSEETRKKTKGELILVAETRMGFSVAEEICKEIETRQADLVVMGVTGAGKLISTLIGSTTTTVLSKTQCPILVVPGSARFSPLHTIAFACDSGTVLPERFSETLFSLINSFRSRFHVLSIQKPLSEVYPGEEKHFSKLTLSKLSAFQPEYHFPIGQNPESGFDEFITSQTVDLLVMVPRHRNPLTGFFHISLTRKIALHTHIPLLSIHQ